jgi:hypothetical protein
MVELDRLVKLLVEKVLRASKKQEPNGEVSDMVKLDETAVSKSTQDEAAEKEETRKMPEG